MCRRLSFIGRLLWSPIIFGLGLCALEALTGSAWSAEVQSEPPVGIPIYLEVYLNDEPTNLIAAFIQDEQGEIWSQSKELRELKINAPASNPESYVKLSTLPSVRYVYEEETQSLKLIASDEVRIVSRYDARSVDALDIPIQHDYGVALNYAFFASAHTAATDWSTQFNGVNVSIDGRMFSPLGTLSQSAILGSTRFDDVDALRLNTTWTYSSRESQLTYRAGDIISGGLPWTRSVRMGGFQIQRNFGLRPDLVTVALPSFSASAAVPSTVDVYVNNVRAYSQPVSSGPFEINNLPVVGRGGTARVVLNDAQGRQTTTELPFYVSPRLLKQGLLDFSAEGGFARFGFGIESWNYEPDFSASATLRYGLTDDLTIEGHSEFSDGLVNAGLGAVFRLTDWGIASVAFSQSYNDGATGSQIYAAYEARVFNSNFNVSTQRAYGEYDDLASKVGFSGDGTVSEGLGVKGVRYGSILNYRVPKNVDTASVSFAVDDYGSSVALSYVNLESQTGDKSQIAGLSYSRQLWQSASGYVTAFVDLESKSDYGLFAGLSMPLGETSTALVGVAASENNVSPSVSASKSLGEAPGSYGWRVSVTKDDIAQSSAFLATRTNFAKIEGGIRHFDKDMVGSLEVSGSIAAIDGDVYFANRIDDSFAIVETGYENTEVLLENRIIGHTNSSGKLLVPGLRAHQRNQISVDPLTLPLEATLSETKRFVAPPEQAGVVVRMHATDHSQSGLVILVDDHGAMLSAGLMGKVSSTEETFVVGYDGQAYVENLIAGADLTIDADNGPCVARLPTITHNANQKPIGPIVCR